MVLRSSGKEILNWIVDIYLGVNEALDFWKLFRFVRFQWVLFVDQINASSGSGYILILFPDSLARSLNYTEMKFY